MDNIFVLNGLSGFLAGPKPHQDLLATDLTEIVLMAAFVGALCLAIATQTQRGPVRWFCAGLFTTLLVGDLGGIVAALFVLGIPQLVVRRVVLTKRTEALLLYRIVHVMVPGLLFAVVAVALGSTELSFAAGLLAAGGYYLFLWRVFPETGLGQDYLTVQVEGEQEEAARRRSVDSWLYKRRKRAS